MPEEQFSKLDDLLRSLRSGLSNFGLNQVHALIYGQDDREFLNKNKNRLDQLSGVLAEIQSACGEHDHPPDPGQIRFLLWDQIKAAKRSGQRSWDGSRIGALIVEQLRSVDDQRLVCIPLVGSAAPRSAAPHMYLLGEGLWLVEPCHTAARLLARLLEMELLPSLPPEVEKGVRDLDDLDPTTSEYGALLSEPLLAFHTAGCFSRRHQRLRRYCIPLLALHNIVTVNRLDTSDDPGLWSYMTRHGVSRWSDELRKEWEDLTDTTSDWARRYSGMTDPHDIVSISDGSRQVASYVFNITAKRLTATIWAGRAPPVLPPILVLPSLFPDDQVGELVRFGDRLADDAISDLERRIGHAVAMWSAACAHAQDEEWSVDFQGDESVAMTDSDSVMLYSTVVLETLFGTSSEKQEVTSRIADMTAGLLGTSPDERYDLAKRMKQAYGRRSQFVHGEHDRPADYPVTAMWLFKIATLTLWETVRRTTLLSPEARKWEEFDKFVQRRKYGAT